MGRKTLWEKEKLLVSSNFSFSHSVFKRLVSQGRQKVSLCGNGLMYNPKQLWHGKKETSEKIVVTSIFYFFHNVFLSLLTLCVMCGLVDSDLTCDQGVLGSSHAGSSGFLVGVSLGKILRSPSLVLIKY